MNNNWLAVHIFYSSNADPMLAECIKPLVEDLLERRLIRRHFFIKYWFEGPHVRLRLLPAEGVGHEDLKAAIEPEISGFLKRRPALYDQPEGMDAFYEKMYVAEYGQESWDREYAATGKIPMAPNNSFKYVPYEPEYGRYGGPHGIEVSEWHFQESSKRVLQLLQDANVHVRTILMGLSPQLSLPLCYEFLGDDRKVIDFLGSYIEFWQNAYAENSSRLYGRFDHAFEAMRLGFIARCREIRAYVLDLPGAPQTTRMERDWLAHARELRQRLADLSEAGLLVFQGGKREEAGDAPAAGDEPAVANGQAAGDEPAAGEQGRKVDLDAALQILLSSYVHMTNNRLGVSILDEIYLSYQLKKALEAILEEETGGAAGEAPGEAPGEAAAESVAASEALAMPGAQA